MEYYTLNLCGLTRELPIIHISKKTRLASFSMLGDIELVEKIASELVKKLKDHKFDYLVGPEVKVVPLIHSLAKRMGYKRYVICRKSVKPHMISPIILKPLAYFPKHVRPLVLDGSDAKLIKDKKVIIVDDVVSTGVTMRMMKKLMEKVNAQVVKTVAVLRQGEQFDSIDELMYLDELPLIKK